jgi:hypothetical protein
MVPAIQKPLSDLPCIPTIAPTRFYNGDIDVAHLFQRLGDIMPKAVNIKLLSRTAEVGIRRVVNVLCKNDVRPV